MCILYMYHYTIASYGCEHWYRSVSRCKHVVCKLCGDSYFFLNLGSGDGRMRTSHCTHVAYNAYAHQKCKVHVMYTSS